MEGLPLKYIAMLIAALIIVSTIVSIAIMFASVGTDVTTSSGETFLTILDNTIGNTLNVTPSS